MIQHQWRHWLHFIPEVRNDWQRVGDGFVGWYVWLVWFVEGYLFFFLVDSGLNLL